MRKVSVQEISSQSFVNAIRECILCFPQLQKIKGALFRWSLEIIMSFKFAVIASRHCLHDDIIKWKHFPRYWPFVRGIHRSLVNSPHKGQWRGALMFSLICAWTNSWANHRDAGELRRHCNVNWDILAYLTLAAVRRLCQHWYGG